MTTLTQARDALKLAKLAEQQAQAIAKTALVGLTAVFRDTAQESLDTLAALDTAKAKADKADDTLAKRHNERLAPLKDGLLAAFPTLADWRDPVFKKLITSVLVQALPDVTQKALKVKAKDRTAKEEKLAELGQSLVPKWKARISVALYGEVKKTDLEQALARCESAGKALSKEEPDGTAEGDKASRALTLIHQAFALLTEHAKDIESESVEA